MRKITVPDHYCELESCGKLLIQKPNEKNWNFKIRRFCDSKCCNRREHRRGRKKVYVPVEKTAIDRFLSL